MGEVDRKRPSEELAQYPSKRPLQELSSGGPLTQTDVVYFKKEAIWRQMKHYKNQALLLASKVLSYEQKLHSFLAIYLLLESWYSYIVELAAKEEPRRLELSDSPAVIAEILEERRAFLHLIMELLASAHNSSEEQPGGPSSEEQPGGPSKLASKCVELEADLEHTKRQRDELHESVKALEARLEHLQNDANRNDSASLKRVLLNSRLVEPEEETHPEPKVEKANGSAKQNAPDPSLLEQELQSLRIEFDTLSAGYKAMEESLKQKDTEMEVARAQASRLQETLADLKEPDLMKSNFYLSVLEKHKVLLDKSAHNAKANELMLKRLEELEARESNYVTLLSKELTDENARLKEFLSKAENDLVRVRTARDEWIGKHAILKLDLESRKDNADLVKMNEVLHERLKHYEDESAAANSPDNESLSHLEKPELIRRLGILNTELKDIEKAFQETRELSLGKERKHVDKESIIKKLTIEKTKADQKYFASMRLKDSLVSENKVLKSQVAKSQELVTKSADLEKLYVSKIELLTKSIDDYKAIKQSSIQEATSLHHSIKQLLKSREIVLADLKMLKTQHGELKAEADAKAEELGILKVAHAKTEAKLRATENLLAKYKLNNTSSILQEDEKQLEALRSISKCSVCSKNWKNMAITACGHVFCDGCVQERLNARLRRCPTCNKGFSANDLLQIHL